MGVPVRQDYKNVRFFTRFLLPFIIKCCNVQLETTGYYLAKTIGRHQLPPPKRHRDYVAPVTFVSDITISGDIFIIEMPKGGVHLPRYCRGHGCYFGIGIETMRLPMVLEKAKNHSHDAIDSGVPCFQGTWLFLPCEGKGHEQMGNLGRNTGP